MRTTHNLPQTDSPALRWGWLDRLAGHLLAAYAGDEGDEGDEGDPATDDDDTAFGGEDEDLDAEPTEEPAADPKEEPSEEEEEEEEDEGFLDDPAEEEEEAEDGDATETAEEEETDEDADLLDEEAQAEHTERVDSLNELWDARMERAVEAGEGRGMRPNVKLGDVKIGDASFKKFKEILAEEGDDAEVQAKAIFEVAMDAAVQALNGYDTQHVQKHLGGMTDKAMQVELDSRWGDFLQTPAGKIANASDEIKGKMREIWDGKVEKAGGSKELAMRIDTQTYFRMAGGRVTKKALAALKSEGTAPTPVKKAAAKASKRKAADLAAAKAPRARRAAGLGQPRKAKTDEQESADYLASEESFFSVQ